jgi:iron complex outermembrane receptor protein
MVSGHGDQTAPRSHVTPPLRSILYRVVIAAAAATLWLPSFCPGSQGGLTTLSLEQLGNLEVTTVSKEPEKLSVTPAAVYVLTQDDIRRSGASSIPEVLRLVPGVEVARIDSDHWSVGIRGFGGQHSSKLLVLMDGRSVYTPLYAGVWWQAQNTLLEDIDRIEVIRGPGGTIWGSNAVNGVINIVTKKARETPGILLSAGGGNLDQGAVSFRYGGGNGTDFNYRLYGMGFNRGPEFHADGRNFDDWHMGQAGFRADWNSGTRNTYAVQGDIYDEYAGESVEIGAFSPPSIETVDRAAKLSGGNLLGRWERVFPDGSDVQLQAYYDHSNHFEPQIGESRNTFDVDFLHHLTLPWHQDFIWGLGGRISSGTVAQTVPIINFVPHHQTETLYSGFVQDEIPLPHQLALTAGSKLEHNNFTGLEVEPSLRLLWTPHARESFWASVTRAVRIPSRLDEDVQVAGLITTNPLPTFLQVAGNGSFFSEQLVAYETGYRRLITPSLYLDVAAFHNDYNYLYSYTTAPPFLETFPLPLRVIIPLIISNGIKGATDGFELAPSWQVTQRWRLKGSYSYLHMDLKGRPGSSDPATLASDEGSSQHHQVVVQSFLNLPGNFEFDQTYRYVSALPVETVPAFGTADVRLGWRPTKHLELSIAGQNLLQPHHVEFAGDPGPLVGIKRSAYARITLRW